MLDAEFRCWADRVARAYESLPASNYYEVLGIAPGATQEAIRQAFHRRAASLHPDRHRGTPEPTRGHAYSLFKRMAEAFRVLNDPDLRRAYDGGLAEGKLRLTDETPRPRLSREDMLRTPAGKRHYAAAAEAIARGDGRAAALNLQLAVSYEGRIPFLVEMIQQVAKGMAEKPK